MIPLFTVEDAEAVFPLLETVPYEKPTEIAPEIRVMYHDAGHILGASMIELRVREGGKSRTVVFSGDIGRWNKPIVRDPSTFEQADVLFMESTYGNRLHETEAAAEEKLQRIILETADEGGNVVIPTFAIERAQELLFMLTKMTKEKKIPELKVFLDSPMAIAVTEVFKRYTDYFDDEAKALLMEGYAPFDFPLLKMVRTADESKGVKKHGRTSIIMAGSGMCTGGRIKHHLVNNIERSDSTILFVGYQAQGTLGRTLLERPKDIRIQGLARRVRARIEKINGFSAHADRDELMRWVSAVKEGPEKVFIVHGEKEASAALAAHMKERIRAEVVVPKYQEVHEL